MPAVAFICPECSKTQKGKNDPFPTAGDLAAHRYDNDGQQLDLLGQLRDSITLGGWPILTALAAPLGLRYHALHHWLPSVPYHSLGVLHRRLLEELPLASPYRRTQRAGILSTVRDLRQWRLQSPLPPGKRRKSLLRARKVPLTN